MRGQVAGARSRCGQAACKSLASGGDTGQLRGMLRLATGNLELSTGVPRARTNAELQQLSAAPKRQEPGLGPLRPQRTSVPDGAHALGTPQSLGLPEPHLPGSSTAWVCSHTWRPLRPHDRPIRLGAFAAALLCAHAPRSLGSRSSD